MYIAKDPLGEGSAQTVDFLPPHNETFLAASARLLVLLQHRQEVLVMLRERDGSAHRDRNRIAHSPLLRSLQAVEQFVGAIPRHREHHLGILRHPEDAIAIAWQHDLRLAGREGLDDDFRAIQTPAGGALDAAAAL